MPSKTPAKPAKARKASSKVKAVRKPLRPGPDGIVRLSGGNPQIAKGDGDGPVQAYIAAMPGWKAEIGRKIDAIVGRIVPGAAKAVKWNTPFYGKGDGTWFVAFHVYEKYVKVTFFKGAQMKPVPPEASKMKDVRYLNIREDAFDEKQFAGWIKQASKLPGEKL